MAIEGLKKTLEQGKQTNNVFFEKMACINLASAYEALKETTQVIDYCIKYLSIPSPDDQDKSDVYLKLGIAYQSTQNREKAYKYFDLALKTAEGCSCVDRAGRAYERLGTYHLYRGNLPKALEYFNKHLEIANTIADRQHQEIALKNLAVVYDTIGDHSTAIDYAQNSLKIALELHDNYQASQIYETLGSIHQKKGDYPKAVECFKRQLEISINIGFKEGQLRSCSCISGVYMKMGEHYYAMQWHNKSMKISTELGSDRNIIMLQSNLAVRHQLLGEYQTAAKYLTMNLDLARKIKDRYLEGLALGNLCSNSVKLGEWEKAAKYSKEGLAVAVETGNKIGESRALGFCAISKMELGQYHEALKFVERQISLSEEVQDKESLSDAFGYKGLIYVNLKDFQQGIFYLERSLETSKEANNKSQEAKGLSILGQVYIQKFSFHLQKGEKQESQNSVRKAEHYLKEALSCWEWLFEHIEDQDHFKISVLDTFINNYSLLSLALLTENKSQEALIVSERGRARALGDQLALKYGLSKPNLSQRQPISNEQIQHMASTCSIVFYLMSSEWVFTWLINQDGCNVKSQSLFRNSSLTDIVTDAYSVLKVREAKGEGRLIETEEHGGQRAVQATTIDIKDGLLVGNIKRCVYDEDITQPLEGLYEQLIAPLVNELTEEEEIVIIPDGRLYTVPFAALKDQTTGSYLSERKRIRLAPSLTSLKTLQDSPAEFHSKSGALVIGNPKVGTVMFKGKMIQVSSLPNAEIEAKKIGELLGVKPILRPQATKQTIKDKLQQGVAMIHFAAHGTHDGEIFLTPPPSGNQQQQGKLTTPPPTQQSLPDETHYLLTMKDVQESDVHPQLVVLSCCHSGRGEVKADGVIGMTRAFLAAGARAVVASLWAIADDATMVFMEKFYSHLKQRKSASTSLHLAMKDMRGIPRYSEPRFWASFFLIGDDVTIEI